MGESALPTAVFVGSAQPPTPNAPPEAAFTFTTDGLIVDFTDESTDSDGDVVAWSWNFGDGNISTEQNPLHCYAAGTYDASLTVTDDQGAQSEQVTDSVAVSAPPGGEVVKVFITSGIHFGALVGLAGADRTCQAAADEAGLAGTWKAWLSGDNTNARDRIPNGQYQLLDRTVIADDKADLTDGELNAPINMDEFGEPDGGLVFTGTQPDSSQQ